MSEVLVDGVALLVAVERLMRDEAARDPADKYTPHEALEVVSGHILHAIRTTAGQAASVEALDEARRVWDEPSETDLQLAARGRD